MHDPRIQFLARLKASFSDGEGEGSFVKLTLGHATEEAGALRKLLLRPVLLRGERRCSAVSRFATRDETKNFTYPEALALVEARLGSLFLSAHLFTRTEEVQLELGKKNRLRVREVARGAATLEHDRNKSRWVAPQGTGAPFLKALGVTDAMGRVRERMGDKFRQIERFVDLLASAFRESGLADRPAGMPVTMCDMGAGKGYLTFAAYDYFARVVGVAGVKPVVTGVESREDLVAFCNGAARECGFEGLRFVQSTIEQFALPSQGMDVLVALHACNTATDDALAAGVRAGAEIILAAPCCHKEIRPQVDRAAAEGPLRDVLRYGIFAERHAEIATDALRALLLERAGYRVRVSEFVAAEHTAKNVMLIATRRQGLNETGAAELEKRIADLKGFYGIDQHRLERLLLGQCELGRPTEAEGSLPEVR